MYRATLFLLALTAAAQDSTVAGRVVDSTGAPIKGVHIRIAVMPHGPNDDIGNVYGAISDGDGRFSISAVAPGGYMLHAEKFGMFFVPSAKGSGPPSSIVDVRPHENRTDLRIEMAPRAVVSGHVFDDNGKPLENVYVHLQPADQSEVALEMVLEFAQIRSVTSNDRGEWRVSLPPGKYTFRAQGISSANEIRTDGTLPPAFSDTFYPAAAGRRAAKVVEAIAGHETSAIDIRMIRGGLFSISGVVNGIPPGATATVYLRDPFRGGPATPPVGKDGSFSADRLPPGDYLVFAESEGEQKLRSMTRQVTLRAANVTNVSLELRAPTQISGTLEMAGGLNKKVVLQPAATGIAGIMLRELTVSGVVGNDGVFEIRGVQPERYKVTIEAMPPDSYLKSVLIDDAAVPDQVLDLSAGGSVHNLKLTTGKAATMSGKVLGKNGPILHGVAGVLLVQDGAEQNFEDLHKLAPDGTYSITGIRPGNYKVVAFDAFESGARANTEPKDFLPLAEEIELKEGERMQKDLKVAVLNAK